jgi:hypothetical protein
MGSPDPALPGLTITESAQADHLLSIDRIRRMPGAAQLDEESLERLFNLPENIVPLSAPANQSKGALSYSEWWGHRELGIPVDPAFREAMVAREAQVDELIQEEINRLLWEQWAAERR